MREGSIEGPVLVLATAADRVAGRDEEGRPRLIDDRDHLAFEQADGVVDVAHDDESKCVARNSL